VGRPVDAVLFARPWGAAMMRRRSAKLDRAARRRRAAELGPVAYWEDGRRVGPRDWVAAPSTPAPRASRLAPECLPQRRIAILVMVASALLSVAAGRVWPAGQSVPQAGVGQHTQPVTGSGRAEPPAGATRAPGAHQ
jgi:hypothetical protein